MNMSSSAVMIFFAVILCLVQSVSSHTWIDCIDRSYETVYKRSAEWIFGGDSKNGMCEGYARGYPGRGDRNINTGFTYTIPRNEVDNPASTKSLCQYSNSDSYNGWRKMAQARAGESLFFAYLPNGHVSKDIWARKTRYGVYWNGHSSRSLETTADLVPEKLVDGKLSYFDDLNCGETYDREGNPSGRAGDFHPCIGNFTIPKGTTPGVYQFAWVWKFYFEKDQNQPLPATKLPTWYSDNAYTSCFDVVVLEEATPQGNTNVNEQSKLRRHL